MHSVELPGINVAANPQAPPLPASAPSPLSTRLVEEPTTLFGRNALLAGIGPAVFNQIAPRIEIRNLAADEIIFAENDPGDALYLIAKGSVRISKRGRGGQQETLTFLPADDFFGEMALVDSGKRSAQASSVGETTVGRMDRATWELLLRFAPNEVMGNFSRAVTQRLRQNNQHFIEQMMRSERLSLLGTTISSIVHDMNNPITTILGACQVIKGVAHDEVTRQMAGMMHEAVKSMEVMTREMVDFSRGETRLNIEPVGVPHLVQQLEPEFIKCRVGCEVKIDVSFEGSIRIDRHRMLRVFGNLIKNAREAMRRSERRALVFSVRRRDPASVVFGISDTGHGIPSDLLAKIFEPFFTSGKPNGTGLGLAIAKSVVEAHGGTIDAQSSEQGTTFNVTLLCPEGGL